MNMENYEKKSLLRFTTSGSVDDGKSTLIGRLMFDSKMLYEDLIGIYTINIDGSGVKTIIEFSNSQGWQHTPRDVIWSPDGNFISYTKMVTAYTNRLRCKTYIYIIGADGSGNECLTNGLPADNWKSNLDWRQVGEIEIIIKEGDDNVSLLFFFNEGQNNEKNLYSYDLSIFIIFSY